MNYVKECLTTKYADFNGRARRAEYWMFQLVTGAVLGVLYVLAMIAGAATADSSTGAPGAAALIFLVPLFLLALATVVPSIAVAVRRLHDRDMSGWMYLIGLIPFGGIVLLVLFCLEGTPGANRFGADPKGRGGDAGSQGFGGQFGQPQFGQPQFGQPAAPQTQHQFNAQGQSNSWS